MDRSLTSSFLIIVFIVFALAAAPLFAGPVAMEKNVAPAPVVCDWTGVYVGAHAGITELQSRFTDVNQWGYDNEGEVSGNGTNTYEIPAFIGGGQAGYNYQWRDLVLGVEADFSGLGGADNHTIQSQSESSGSHEDYGTAYKAKIDYMG